MSAITEQLLRPKLGMSGIDFLFRFSFGLVFEKKLRFG